MPNENENTNVTITENEDGTVTIVVPEGVEVEFVQTEKEEVTTAAPSALDKTLTIGLVALLALVVVIAVIRKVLYAKKMAANVAIEEEPEAEPVQAPTAPGSAGELKLHNVEPKTAAMLMAIVADKLGKPLNELRFISIKEVE